MWAKARLGLLAQVTLSRASPSGNPGSCVSTMGWCSLVRLLCGRKGHVAGVHPIADSCGIPQGSGPWPNYLLGHIKISPPCISQDISYERRASWGQEGPKDGAQWGHGHHEHRVVGLRVCPQTDCQHCPGWAWCWDMLGRCCACCGMSTHVQKHICTAPGIWRYTWVNTDSANTVPGPSLLSHVSAGVGAGAQDKCLHRPGCPSRDED